MTRQQKIKLINDLTIARDEVYARMDDLNGVISPDPGCKLYGAIFELLGVAIDSTAAAIGDDMHKWLDWFIHENDCGRKGYEAGYEGRIKPIRTIEDLLDLIEQGEE